MSQAGALSASSGPIGPNIEEILGDTGSISGNIVTIFADQATNNSGASVSFNNSGTVSTLNLTDANNNTFLGFLAGNVPATSTAADNTAVGVGALNSVTISSENVAIGHGALQALTGPIGGAGSNVVLGMSAGAALLTGSNNIIIGSASGSAYVGAETNNIVMNTTGVAAESNVLRLGQVTGGAAQTKAFIAGIIGNTVSNTQAVTINSSTGQLGIATFAPAYAYTATAISYQVLTTDKIIGVTSNAAARTITMPNAGMIAGQSWTIKDEAGTAQSANNITIDGANIDGAATFVINTNFGSATLYWNGTNFFVI